MRNGKPKSDVPLPHKVHCACEPRKMALECAVIVFRDAVRYHIERMQCTCRLEGYVGRTAPCETCRMQRALANFLAAIEGKPTPAEGSDTKREAGE